MMRKCVNNNQVAAATRELVRQRSPLVLGRDHVAVALIGYYLNTGGGHKPWKGELRDGDIYEYVLFDSDASRQIVKAGSGCEQTLSVHRSQANRPNSQLSSSNKWMDLHVSKAFCSLLLVIDERIRIAQCPANGKTE